MVNLYRTITGCRSCYSRNLDTVLDLGEPYISDFVLPGEPEERAPLELVICQDCGLVQLRHTVNRERLYKNYYYRSGVNESMVAALKDVVADAVSRVELSPDDKVLDIGANDGTLLSFYPRIVWAHGFEPAKNLQREAMLRGHARIFPTFFPPRWAVTEQYKVITSIAMFYDLDQPNAFVAAVKECLHPDGVWIVQFQDLDAMVGCNGVDNICHEHLLYLSRSAFATLLERHGLYIEDASYNGVNGGSVRYVVRHGTGEEQQRPWVRSDLAGFGQRVRLNRDALVGLLRRLRDEGKTVLGVAASTKANTTLQYYNITPELLPAIVDRNPEKHGRQMVGTHIPIISEEEMWERKPSYLLALAWHFFEPFRRRYADFQGTWILPMPELRLIQGGEICPSIKEGTCGKGSAKSFYAIPS